MQASREVAEIIDIAISIARGAHFEYVTPELILFAACQNKVFARAFENCGGEIRVLDYQLRDYLEKYMETVVTEAEVEPEFSVGMSEVLTYAWISAQGSGRDVIELTHVINALFEMEESYAVYYMRLQGVEKPDLLQEMALIFEDMTSVYSTKEKSGDPRGGSRPNRESGHVQGSSRPNGESGHVQSGSRINGESGDGQGGNRLNGESGDGQSDSWLNGKSGYGQGGNRLNRESGDGQSDGRINEESRKGLWQQYATCLNDELDGVNPLIGREEELERTMQILCRKDKNNPLHIGEPGVGKTAITYGLARLLNDDQVPEPLLGARIFSLDLGGLLAGTQYRGDFEKRFKKVMDSIGHEEKPIVYIDEIHNIVGAGAVNGGSFDISNMLKPYLAAGRIRFIGATTYEEYKKHFEKSKSLVRRFQNIDINEPSIQECVQILEGLKANYEKFHDVLYEDGVLEYAVEMSAKYMNERYLPDKAVDLIDEAGAYRRMHPLDRDQQTVDKDLIDEILSRTCHIPKQVVESDETEVLATLEVRLKNRVFGQDEAISQVVNAVKFSRAGLLEEGKPLASLLFVGPTGVGKTEIAKSLAEELGVKLVRFDMSEYEEKHAVAKLIGAPAGYVGYEEGGLLTEEIRKNPYCVLLLDEIEKAHPDIYNILLQVMDYATLTDNQGRKADFRNVIVIMTSNAGASGMGKHGIGFVEQDVKTNVILEEVKRIFQPEFRNRLNRIVVFRGMDESMAERIVEKKLGELQKLLAQKNVKLSADAESKKLVKQKGISAEFGAREIERVIQGQIKPLLVDEILFGALKDGGKCRLTVVDDNFLVSLCSEAKE